MKKSFFKKVLTSTAAIFTIAALTAFGTSVYAVESPTLGTDPAYPLETPASTATVTLKKDIVLFNADACQILSPNVTYSYEITSANVTNATVTTLNGEDTVIIAVRPGVIEALSTDFPRTTEKVEGRITFGAADDAHNNDSEMHDANYNSDSIINLSKKVSSSMEITVDADKIYDPNGDGTQDNQPGVYRYKIADVTTDETLTYSGIQRGSADSTIYLDVYTKYNSENNGLEIYGYVLLRSTKDGSNVSLEYDNSAAEETIKITGFDVESENGNVQGGTVKKAELKSDSYYTYNVEVGHEMAGDLADKQNNFPFRVELSNPVVTSQADFYYQITKDGAAKTAVNTSLSPFGSWTLDGNSADPANDLQLQSGDKIVITGLPAETKIKVAETNDTDDIYAVSATGNGTSLVLKNDDDTTGTSISVRKNGTAEMNDEFNVSSGDSTDKIVFTGTLKSVSITGLTFNIAPFAFITIAGVGLLVLVIRNKKSYASKSKI
ncbi:MAG: hypothetical protein J5589_10985 [Firmicutes bacterium]|nr:hypothetical protein [Bacillota bacterium]